MKGEADGIIRFFSASTFMGVFDKLKKHSSDDRIVKRGSESELRRSDSSAVPERGLMGRIRSHVHIHHHSESMASSRAPSATPTGPPLAVPRARANTSGLKLETPPRSVSQLPTETTGLPSTSMADGHSKPKKMQYNPYGLNSSNPNSPAVAGAGPSRLFSSMDPVDDTSRELPKPVHDPNDHLPLEFKEEHSLLTDEYSFVNDKSFATGASASIKKIQKNATTSSGKKGTIYALKKLVLFKNEAADDFYSRAANEYIIHKTLSSGFHIVNVNSLVRVSHQQNISAGWGLVLDMCKADFFSLIEKPNWASLTQTSEKLCLFKQICFGVKFMHDHDIVHRDLKPENVLIDANGMVKLTDFGVSSYGHVEPGNFHSPIAFTTQLVGSPPYQPPEIQEYHNPSLDRSKRKPYNPFLMDYWALGIILFVIFQQKTPFDEAWRKDQKFRDYESSYDNYCAKAPNFRHKIWPNHTCPEDCEHFSTDHRHKSSSASSSSSSQASESVHTTSKGIHVAKTKPSSASLNSMGRSSSSVYISMDTAAPSSSHFTSKPKGPGSEYKFAKKFPDANVARIAWRLCDPKPASRWAMIELFEDPEFQSWDMCVKENECVGTFLLNDDAWEQEAKLQSADDDLTDPTSAGTNNGDDVHDMTEKYDGLVLETPSSLERSPTENSMSNHSTAPSAQVVTQNGANDIKFDLSYNSGCIIVPNTVVKKCCSSRAKKHHHI